MEALRAHPKTALIYSDEDILVDGVRQSPWFKPDFSPELLLSANYLSGAWFHSDLIQSAALSASDPDQLSWQLGLHAADSQVAHHLPTVLLHHPQANRAQPIHPAQVSDPSSARKVSIIIPTREQPETLRTCLDSIFSLSDYPDFEIILVDNASQEAETLAYYDELKANDKIRFVEYPETFNYQAANNRGVAAGQGEVLLFLNNDTEVLEPGWLEEMVRWVDRSGVGVVGAKLLFPDGTIQHAGVVLGLMGHAHHIFWGGPEDQTGPFGSPSWYRNYSAVTGACLMIERETFEQVGGFDEGLSLGFGDLDLCLKVRELGQRIVYTPFARLVHHEGRSRGAHVPISDMVATYDRVEALLEAGDPYFNPNLSTLNTLPIPRTAAEPRPAEHLRNTLFRIRGPRKRGYLDPNAMKRPFERRLFQAAAEQRPLELNQIKPATAGVLRPPHSQLSFLLSVTSGGQDRVLSFDPSARWLDPQPEIELASLPDQSPVKLPYTDRQFTHVYLGDGLARVPDWAGLLREALRVCQRSVQFHLPNGDLLTELGQAALLQGPLADPAHQYIYSADILDNLLETINDREGSPDLRWELQTFGRLQDNHPSPKGWIFGRIQKEHPQNLLD
jgi:GT2 family glycosyltransferase